MKSSHGPETKTYLNKIISNFNQSNVAQSVVYKWCNGNAQKYSIFNIISHEPWKIMVNEANIITLNSNSYCLPLPLANHHHHDKFAVNIKLVLFFSMYAMYVKLFNKTQFGYSKPNNNAEIFFKWKCNIQAAFCIVWWLCATKPTQDYENHRSILKMPMDPS